MRFQLWLLAVPVLLLAVPRSYAAYPCRTDPHHSYDVSSLKMANSTNPDSQANLFDYGVIFEDAHESNSIECQNYAAIALYKKVRWTLALPYYIDSTGRFGNTYIGPYQGWLDGAQTSLVYATALRLGALGRLPKPLADLIDQIDYVQNIDRNCGFASNRKGQNGVWVNGNSCMDDWAVAASGSAWTAAWRAARNKPYTQTVAAANAAKTAIAESFNLHESVCAHRPGDAFPAPAIADGPCTGSLSELASGTAVALGLHGGDEPAYGFGLLTSIASADVALNHAGYPHSYTTAQKTVATALMKNADLHTVSGGSAFKNDCYRFQQIGGAMYRYADSNCAGVGYQPGMFALAPFYNSRLGGAPTAVNYNFNTFGSGPWCGTLTCAGGFWNPGRKVIYETFGHEWVITAPVLSAQPSDYTVRLKTYDGVHYVSARNGGGSDVHAEATYPGAEETFSLFDVNGGKVVSGDTVWLQTMEGQYISADNGGGGDVYAVHFTPIGPADGQTTGGWERFIIEKTWGSGQINDGDPVAFRTMHNYYWSAIDEGGGQLLAPYFGVVTWEVFTIDLTHN